RSAPDSAPSGSGLDFEDDFQFYRRTKWKTRDPKDETRSDGLLAEDVAIQFRRRIGDFWVLGELRRGDVHAQSHDVAHSVQRTQLLLGERQRIECGCLRRLSARLHVQVFAHDANCSSRVARNGEHPAQEEEIARLNGGHVRAKWRWRLRQSKPERPETV